MVGQKAKKQEEEEDSQVQDIPVGAIGSDEDGEDAGKTNTKVKAMNVSLKDVKISSEGRVTVAGRLESGKTKIEEGAVRLLEDTVILISFLRGC